MNLHFHRMKICSVLRRTANFIFAVLALALAGAVVAQQPASQATPPSYALNDSHFHLTNYVQEGTDIRKFLDIMGTKVGRVALFGIPLQQQWSYGNTGDFAPTYYLQTDAPLYYYSFTDAYIAMAYKSLSPEQQTRFDPMTTGFNPADMYAFTKAVNAAHGKYKTLQEGKNADYIPALAKVDPNLFGIVLITVDGKVYTAGDITSEVSIQSISKVFTMAKVMQESGGQALVDNMGVDATGMRFNSIIAIELYKGKEMNPLVNPGAITATSMIKGATPAQVWATIINTHSDFAGRPLSVNQEVYKSEAETNQRNQAIASLRYAYGRIKDKPAQACDLYTKQCAISVNTKDLAAMAATLANGGKNPVTNKQVLETEHVPAVLAVMATAGKYDDSGKWLYYAGLPAKSGVGGGVIAVSPGKWGIASISPPLNEAGNSVRAQRAIIDISNALGGNPYGSKPKAIATR